MKSLAFLTVILLAITSAPLGAKRIALVIGNASYDSSKPLNQKPNLHNTRADADLVAATFKGLGFEVVLLKDATKASIQLGLSKVKALGQGSEIGLVYFSGHGMEVNGSNYLCPVGARLASRKDPDTYHVNLDSILRTMESAQIKAKMVVLDCCRNDPFQPASKSIVVENSADKSGGLGVIDRIPHSTLVMYAAGPGQTATSGFGRNSPFTEIFCAVIKDPKISCFEAFFRVSDHVKRYTQARQQPWVKFDGAADAFRKYTFHGTAPTATDSTTNVVSSSNQDNSQMAEEVARIEEEIQNAYANGLAALGTTPPNLREKENEALSVFLRGWLANQESNSPLAWTSDFAPLPKYCYYKGANGAPALFLQKDRRELIERYPQRSYSVIGKVTGEFFDNYERAVAVISYHYEYQGVKKASGNSFNTLGLKKINGEWKITAYDETVRKNANIPSTQPAPVLNSLVQIMAKGFTDRWLKNNKSNNASDWVSDFAPNVNYCYKKDGLANHQYLSKDRQELINKFPNRSYKIVDFQLISPSAPENRSTSHLLLRLRSREGKVIRQPDS